MNTDETESRAALREAMRMQERACASDVPPFACIAAHIEGEPSIFEAPAWSVRKSARLAASLAAAQVRAMPWAVLPMALLSDWAAPSTDWGAHFPTLLSVPPSQIFSIRETMSR